MKNLISASLLLCALSLPAAAATPGSAPDKKVLTMVTPSAETAPAVPAPARQKIFNAETYTLGNGMQVVLIPNHRAPVAMQMVWYKVGRADEATGKSGLAHFLEHLMFKGSKNVAPGELSKRIRAMGGNDNAFTTDDFTAYFQTIAVDKLESAMTMEADRMRGILLPEDQFESERQVVLEERRMRTENDPRSYFMDQLRYALYPGHPYSIPIIGWKPEIEKLTLADARAWHEKWYAPNNAILVVTGDLTLQQLKPMVEKTYGRIPSRPVTRTELPAVAEFPGENRLTLRDPRIREPQFIRMYRVPGFTQNKQEALALDVLEEIMSGNSSTRLYQSLVVTQKVATAAGFSYDDTSRGTTIFSGYVSPAEGKTLEDAEDAYDAEIKKLIEGGVTVTELSEAKTRIRDSIGFLHDSLTTPANVIGQALASGIALDDIEYWPDEIDTVTAEQVKAVAAKYLVPRLKAEDKPNYITGYIMATKRQPGDPEPAPAMPAQEIR
ncbi:MAG: insulinase family protein [Micavibrio sp.]|nr:insulinase family protein [Micavibrio sp.]